MTSKPISLSVVVPVYDEQDNLKVLKQAITAALKPLAYTWEVIFVDDGSQDESLRILEELAADDPQHVRLVALRRNFGQTAAIAAGIDHAGGEIIVPMDADMQNDPMDIPMLLEKIQEGYDVVSGWRKNREDRFLTRTLPSNMANWLISWVTGVHLHDYGCTLKAYRREVITGFRLYGEMHRFIPVYADSVGAKITEVVVRHHPRKYGRAKYGLERTLKVVLDLFTVKFLKSYASKPIYLFGGAGISIILISGLILLYLFIRRIFFFISPFDSPLFQASLMFSIFGFQSILMGLIAELLMRTYHESQGKPIYSVRKTLNTQPSESDPGEGKT
jgi:glycosyltransferase involved in cell wall biosynthesis